MKWEQPSPRCDQWLNARCYEARDSRTKTSLTIIGLATTIYAGLLHCFNVEAFVWEESTARSLFDDSAEEARKHVFYASNQGVYTLFFALGGLIGAILACVSHGEGTLFVVGNTLAIFATASMLCAALVLFITSKEQHSAAIKQGMFPLIAVVGLVIGLAI